MTYTEAGQLPLGYQWYPMPVFGNLPQADQDVDLPEVEISKLLTQDPATQHASQLDISQCRVLVASIASTFV